MLQCADRLRQSVAPGAQVGLMEGIEPDSAFSAGTFFSGTRFPLWNILATLLRCPWGPSGAHLRHFTSGCVPPP